MGLTFYNIRYKDYNNGLYQLTHFHTPIALGFTKSNSTILYTQTLDKKEQNIYRSMLRTKQKIYDYCMSNNWEYFLTITFDQNKVDRYNYLDVSKKLSKLLNNIKTRKCNDLKYILVPEYHKDNAIHFHCLLSNINGLTFVDSGKRTTSNQIIYNISDFNLGFTSAINVFDSRGISNYITKYITKDLTINLFGKRKYWVSKNLDIPLIEKFLLTDKQINLVLINKNIINSKTKISYILPNGEVLPTISYYNIQKNVSRET